MPVRLAVPVPGPPVKLNDSADATEAGPWLPASRAKLRSGGVGSSMALSSPSGPPLPVKLLLATVYGWAFRYLPGHKEATRAAKASAKCVWVSA